MPVKSIRFPDELAAAFQARADELDRSFSWVVLRALESALASAGSSGSEDRMPRSLVREPVSSRAPVEKKPANLADAGDSKVAKADRGGSPASSRQAFKCPDLKCGFRAFSAKAVCGNHGRMVVPA